MPYGLELRSVAFDVKGLGAPVVDKNWNTLRGRSLAAAAKALETACADERRQAGIPLASRYQGTHYRLVVTRDGQPVETLTPGEAGPIWADWAIELAEVWPEPGQRWEQKAEDLIGLLDMHFARGSARVPA